MKLLRYVAEYFLSFTSLKLPCIKECRHFTADRVRIRKEDKSIARGPTETSDVDTSFPHFKEQQKKPVFIKL